MKQNKKIKGAIILFTLVLPSLVVISACSGAKNGGGGGGPQGGPPPEAITACEGKSVGDTASFKGRRGETLEATCKEIDGQLVAFPEGAPPRK